MVRGREQEVKFARKNSRKFTRNRIFAGDCLPDNNRFLLQSQTAPILTMICGLRMITLLQLLFRQFEEIYFEIRFARGNQLIDHQVQNLMSNNVIFSSFSRLVPLQWRHKGHNSVIEGMRTENEHALRVIWICQNHIFCPLREIRNMSSWLRRAFFCKIEPCHCQHQPLFEQNLYHLGPLISSSLSNILL